MEVVEVLMPDWPGLTPDTWHAVGAAEGLAANWTNGGALAYSRDADGTVRIKGEISAGAGAVVASNTTLFTLPAGYRPAFRSYFPVSDNSGSTNLFWLLVNTIGQVKTSDNAATWVVNRVYSLSTVQFRAEG